MRSELTNEEMEQVSGGSVRLNTTKMMIGFSVLQQKYKVVNCTDEEASSLVLSLYFKYKTAGDLAYEQATLDAFNANGWLAEA